MTLREKALVLVVLVSLSGAAWAWVRAGAHRDRADAEARAREAAELERDGAIVAHQATRRELERAASAAAGLESQVDALTESLGTRPRTQRVVEWRTKEIEVPVEKIVEVPKILRESMRLPDGCTGLICTGSIEFDVRGREADLLTEAGNTVLVGEAELWRTAPPPEVLLGSAAYRQDVTSLLVAPEPPVLARHEVAVGVATDGVEGRYSRAWGRSRRFVTYAQVGYDPTPDEVKTYYDFYRADRFRASVGLGWRF